MVTDACRRSLCCRSHCDQYAIYYAYMPIRVRQIDPRMARLPEALRERMRTLGHVQTDVSAATGVPQPQISRALAGARKRPTPPMLELCRYADVEPPDSQGHVRAIEVLVQQLMASVGNKPGAAQTVRGVLENLIPLVEGAPR